MNYNWAKEKDTQGKRKSTSGEVCGDFETETNFVLMSCICVKSRVAIN